MLCVFLFDIMSEDISMFLFDIMSEDISHEVITNCGSHSPR